MLAGQSAGAGQFELSEYRYAALLYNKLVDEICRETPCFATEAGSVSLSIESSSELRLIAQPRPLFRPGLGISKPKYVHFLPFRVLRLLHDQKPMPDNNVNPDGH